MVRVSDSSVPGHAFSKQKIVALTVLLIIFIFYRNPPNISRISKCENMSIVAQNLRTFEYMCVSVLGTMHFSFIQCIEMHISYFIVLIRINRLLDGHRGDELCGHLRPLSWPSMRGSCIFTIEAAWLRSAEQLYH